MLSVKSRGLLSQPIVGAMLLVSVMTALPPASFAQQRSAVISGQLDTNYTLGGGDRIKVNVYEVPDYTGEYQIPPGGAINLPLIGSVSLLGVTTEDAAELIRKKYERFLKRPIISVNLLSPRPINIFVAGEVTRPGSYSLSLQGGAGQDPGVQYPTILSALTTAQGTTLSADVSQVEVFRKIGNRGEQRVVLNLRELIRTGQTNQDITLRDGDRIVVNRATSINLADVRNLSAASFSADISRPRTVAIIGEVNRPGSYLVTSGTTESNAPGQTGGAGVAGLPTISKAIQQAGGITPQADLRNVTIRRLTRTGDPQSLTVNLMQLLQGDIDQDQILQDGDTIFIATGTEINRAEATQLATTTLSPSRIQVGVVGEVKRPGPVDIIPNSSLNQALLAAGGFNDARASRGAVDLVRLNPDGSVTKRVVKIDLASGINEQTNPILRNNDVIIVSRNGPTKTGDSVGAIFNPIGSVLGIFRALFGF
jgi:polysaccharide biosynthesis/export protein